MHVFVEGQIQYKHCEGWRHAHGCSHDDGGCRNSLDHSWIQQEQFDNLDQASYECLIQECISMVRSKPTTLLLHLLSNPCPVPSAASMYPNNRLCSLVTPLLLLVAFFSCPHSSPFHLYVTEFSQQNWVYPNP